MDAAIQVLHNQSSVAFSIAQGHGMARVDGHEMRVLASLCAAAPLLLRAGEARPSDAMLHLRLVRTLLNDFSDSVEPFRGFRREPPAAAAVARGDFDGVTLPWGAHESPRFDSFK